MKKKHKGDSYLSFRSQFLDSTYSIMTTNKKKISTTRVTAKRLRSLRSSRSVRMMQEFHLIWLNAEIDENNNDCYKNLEQLCEVTNNVNALILLATSSKP